jgi:hypothetical protein
MSKRPILFPAVAAMSLWLTACTDPIVGDWELRFLAGERWPVSGTDEGCSYRDSLTWEIDEDLDVKFIANTSDTCYGDYTYIFRGEVEVEDKRKKYKIEFFDEAYDSIFECELDDDDELQCDDLEYDGRYEFERK